jgi:broad specificity phosphatase PhoE
MTKRLTLLRHGKTGFSGKYVGSQDVVLSAEGVLQMESLKDSFENYPVENLISSPMIRCKQSCEILFPHQAVCYDEDLREVDFGRWETMNFQEIVKKDPELVDSWSKWSLDFCFPEGERIGHFVKRVQRAGENIKKSPETHIMIVAHGGVIRNLICYFLNLNPSLYLLFNVRKGCYTTLDLFDNGAVLTGLNHGVVKG